MDMIISPKKGVTEKMKIWEEKKKEKNVKRPVNVIFLGIDSISRSHLYRSLPQTVSLMKKLGFIDFKGYHSIAPSTLTNFMGFLMGLMRQTVRETCAKNWSSSFDACPLIWKNFSQGNYITSYMEDGSQTFNWGNQGGFREPPTDYYFHHLFLALADSRKADFKV